jgi:hypothetical protein
MAKEPTYVLVTAEHLDALRAALAAALDALDRLEDERIEEPLQVPPRFAAPTPEELAELF